MNLSDVGFDVQIKEGWAHRPLGDPEVAAITMGQSPPSHTYNSNRIGLPFFQGKADFGNRFPRPRLWCSEPAKTAESGDILISVRAPVGDVNISNVKCCIGRGLAAIRARENTFNEFLFYVLIHLKSQLEAFGTGATFKAINKNVLHDFIIPVPSRPEQIKISKLLSLIHGLIENQEKLILTLRELKAATMAKLFREGLNGEPLKKTEIGEIPESWDVKQIIDVIRKTEVVDLAAEKDRQIKYIDVSGISREFNRVEDSADYILKNAPGRARKKIKEGDVIFATVRPTLLRIAHIGHEFDDQVCSTAFCVLRDNDTQTKGRFLFYALQRELFIDRLGQIQSGASYPAITDKQLKLQLIPFPPMDEQIKIADQLEKIDRSIEMQNKKLSLLNELFKTMLHSLMTGQIRVDKLDEVIG